MKKLLFLFMIFCFIGVTTISAAPVEEKQVMVFVLDVGLVTTATVTKVATIDITTIDSVKPSAIYTGLSLFRKIVYEPMFSNNDKDNLKRTVNAIQIGDTVPIAA